MKRYWFRYMHRPAGAVLFFSLLLLPAKGALGSDEVEKISPLLKQEVDFLVENPQFDYSIPLIVQVQRTFFQRQESARRGRAQRSDNSLVTVSGYRARLTARQIKHLLRSPLVKYVTLDAVIRPAPGPGGPGSGNGDHDGKKDKDNSRVARAAIGADQIEDYSGDGVVVAVFDSGIEDHEDLDRNKRTTVIVDFTGGYADAQNRNEDKYGHGTHVAGIIGGDGHKSHKKIAGVASDVEFVDLRVIGDDGIGLTSNLIQAIDWVIANKAQYGIRVANLSLGHPPVESYRQDPLCQAVERMAKAGIAVVVSAGNLGKTDNHPRIWGAITSPGNDPEVITVGSVNTQETETHSDDIATSYGSRGPTFSDALFKPDLSAPGNRIPSLLSKACLIEKEHKKLKVDKNYISLSGSSMSAAYVTGTVALMLEANPHLTPHVVKAVLSLTAIKLKKPHMLEQGNGLLNTYTAVKMAEQLDVANKSLKQPVAPYWYLKGEKVWAGGAIAFTDRVYYGDLVSKNGTPLWGDGATVVGQHHVVGLDHVVGFDPLVR